MAARIDLTKEEAILKSFKQRNEQNRTDMAVYESKMESKRNIFKELFEKSPELSDLLDLDKLDDKVYVKNAFNNIFKLYEKSKEEFNLIAESIEEAQKCE